MTDNTGDKSMRKQATFKLTPVTLKQIEELSKHDGSKAHAVTRAVQMYHQVRFYKQYEKKMGSMQVKGDKTSLEG